MSAQYIRRSDATDDNPLHKQQEDTAPADDSEEGDEAKEGDEEKQPELSVDKSEVDKAREEVVRLNEVCKAWVYSRGCSAMRFSCKWLWLRTLTP